MEQQQSIVALDACRNMAPVTRVADVDRASVHVPKDLVVPQTDSAEQHIAIALMDVRRNTALVVRTQADVDQEMAHVLRDIAVTNTEGVEKEQAIAALDACRNMEPVTIVSHADRASVHVPKDLAVPHTDCVE